jgi:diguanylate cyclase (GGDEF)-like protein
MDARAMRGSENPTMQPSSRSTRLARGGALLLAAALAAPAAASPTRPIRFEHLSLEQGLSQSTVMQVLQDRVGYVWLATEDGLNRYDGQAFRTYKHDPADATSLPSSFVWSLDEDAAGNLWIGTSNGLALWERATDRVVRQDVLSGVHIRVVRVNPKDQTVWVGTRDAGLARVDIATGALSRFTHDADAASLSDDRVYALYVDRQFRLWVGSDGGLDLFDGQKGFSHLTKGLGSSKVRAILEDDLGSLWVGTANAGLYRRDPAGTIESFRHHPADPDSLAHDYVRALLQDAEGRLWVATSGGLDLFDPHRRTFAHYRHQATDPGSLGDDHVLSLAQDRGGVLWVGTRLGGVHKWNPLSWQFGHVAPNPESPTGLGSGRVTSFSEDHAGRLWIGTFDAGLYSMNRVSGEVTAYRNDPRKPGSLASDRIMALHRSHKGDLWVGTLDGGLDRLDPATGAVVHYRHDAKNPASLSSNGVTSILEDNRGLLWLGTYGGGLSRLDPETGEVTVYRHDPQQPSSLAGDRVAALAESPEGKLWVGTMEKGLDLLDPRTGRFTHLAHRPGDPRSLPSDEVHALFVDVAGTLWVGTHSGLARLSADGQAFETFTTRNGLPNDVVYAIRADSKGRLWLSTNNGLSAFDPRTLSADNYGVSHGLQAPEFNFGAWYQSASGELFFGGVNGFNAFYPERIRQAGIAPAVVLTSLTVDHRPFGGPPDQAREVRLGFRDKVLGFRFAALDFTAPHNNKYAYKLEGFDPDWVQLGSARRVTYTNLDPGRYTFRLRAANSGGRWNEDGLAIPVTVAAAPWTTGWAFAGYGIFILGGILGLTRVQQRKFEREAEYARALEDRVHERTRELSDRQDELQRLNDELAQASITDSLTGLANRRFLAEYIEKEVALLHRRYRNMPEGSVTPDSLDLAFLMIDLDHFKKINDTAGHAAGDAVLRQLRDILKAASRTSDIIVRWGGDEFVLVARDLSGEGLSELAERIRTRVAQHVFEIGDGRVVRISCSVGFAAYPFFREQLDALTWEQVISVADRALYVAKASGRNAWVGFNPGITMLPIQGLFGAICTATQALVREGTLRVTHSGLRNLIWDAPEQEKSAAG